MPTALDDEPQIVFPGEVDAGDHIGGVLRPDGVGAWSVRVALAFAAFAGADRNAKPLDRSGNVANECSRCLLFIKRSNTNDSPHAGADRSSAM